MDRATALENLGLSSQDWGNAVSAETYEEFVSGWRGSVSCPTEEQIIQAMPSQLAELKKKKIIELKNYYNLDVATNVIVGVNAISYTWKGDLESASFIRDRILADEHSVLPAVDHWYDIDHTKVIMVRADLLNIAAAIALKDHGARENLENCRAAVMAATTQAELDAIAW